MTDDKKPTAADRMDGGYEPPILAEPKGGPIPSRADAGGGDPDVADPPPPAEPD